MCQINSRGSWPSINQLASFHHWSVERGIHKHCRFLVPDNTQKILTELGHHFWLKNDDEKWSRKNDFQILKWPSELLLPRAKKSAKIG